MKLHQNMLAQMRDATRALMNGGPQSATSVIQKALGGLLPGHADAPATAAPTPDSADAGNTASGRAAPAHGATNVMRDINPPPASAKAQAASASAAAAAAEKMADRMADKMADRMAETPAETTHQAAAAAPAAPAAQSAQEKAQAFAQDFAQDFMARLGVPNLPSMPGGLNLGSFDLPGFGGVSKAPVPLAEGAQFLSGSFSNHAGQRDYKLYIPSSYHGQAMPLVVMLHGCTQNPDDFAAGTQMNAVAEEKQCLVVYPAQTSGANSSRCWNWFNALDQQRDQGEPSIIAGIARKIMDEYPVDERQVYVAGLSAGGAMAVIVGTLYPDVFAAVGVHSGLPFASARDLPSALAAMRSGGMASPASTTRGGGIPIIVFHGDRDTTVNPRNGEELIAQGLRDQAGHAAAAASVDSGSVPNGHSYTRTTHRQQDGSPLGEHWVIHGAGHAWSGGSEHGTYTDGKGPDASREMMRFFEAVV